MHELLNEPLLKQMMRLMFKAMDHVNDQNKIEFTQYLSEQILEEEDAETRYKLERIGKAFASLGILKDEVSAEKFSARFRMAFAKLDRDNGSHNFVSLVDLRRDLACFSREVFDEGLRQLRIAREFSLSTAEGRYGISEEQRDAGINEGGRLLLYVIKY